MNKEKQSGKKKDKQAPAPIMRGTPPAVKKARTLANKARRMAKDAKLKAKAQLKITPVSGKLIDIFHVNHRAKTLTCIDETAKIHKRKFEVAHLAKTMFTLEERAHGVQ